MDRVTSKTGEVYEFIPDAAFTLTQTATGKTLLFLVEVDMATEPVKRNSRDRQSEISRKIAVYRTYLGRKGYQKYETGGLFDGSFRGFRLLLITSPQKRLDSLARLVRDMHPTDFVWLCDRSAVESPPGLGGPIWIAGGQAEGPRRSILGNHDLRFNPIERTP